MWLPLLVSFAFAQVAAEDERAPSVSVQVTACYRCDEPEASTSALMQRPGARARRGIENRRRDPWDTNRDLVRIARWRQAEGPSEPRP